MTKPFSKILIANRGEIACRVIKSARKMGIATVAVYSDADKDAVHVRMADEAVHLGPPQAAKSYLLADKIIAACKETGAEAVHPGYGFLSENAKFCAALEEAGIVFIGPKPKAIEAMGDKITSKKIAAEAGVSTVPGHMGLIEDAAEAARIAADIGYPVMIKASAGGGGKGMRIAWTDEEAKEGFERSKSEAASSFGDDRIFIEKFVVEPRHIEIQVLADAHGNCLYLNERECSIQRRNQKVVEEAPSPFLDEETRRAMGEQSVALAKAVDYQSAGTVEFIVDKDRNFYFLEMNTRLQVEHPVTELITGVDLVEQMIRIASGEKLALTQADIGIDGWAIESRLYAEDPYRNFLPSIGRLTAYAPPPEGPVGDHREAKPITDGPAGSAIGGGLPVIRNDTGVDEGGEISMFYDPMIAKLCTWAPTREAAIEAMADALDSFEIEGIGHNLPFLQAVMEHPRFKKGELSTAFIAEEYPDGFAGAALDDDRLRLVAATVAMARWITERRASFITGRMKPVSKAGPKTVPLIVSAAGQSFEIAIDHAASAGFYERDAIVSPYEDETGAPVFLRFVDEDEARSYRIAWKPGFKVATLFSGQAGGEDWRKIAALKLDLLPGGFRVRYRGADLKVAVMSPKVAKLAALMPEKVPPDTSNLLLCPMPGLVVALHVEEGQRVEQGQALAIIEAMKMENVLRAENAGTVAKIPVAVGESLAVDQVIMEFER
ncbi:acetyl-CoA carboxylase biotin carboxylase subunit [Jiella marina]|uniref:acetyl-CoA carboxylase biotin carboxylase subunit n=1 Tax=Jiella sp. LLJ827 TaxID=2917712 RepID=UPI002101472F|nr:acetyl/propionyl/methylcrotonyl-CoA carboxylase subunit alpha [Jiella sp. LLJ827]MCQ0986932.1 acetyl/propionyl/methylcrotonyl-CoA carboxylase subunit alpha [Jiella sp. LLJ827]